MYGNIKSVDMIHCGRYSDGKILSVDAFLTFLMHHIERFQTF